MLKPYSIGNPLPYSNGGRRFYVGDEFCKSARRDPVEVEQERQKKEDAQRKQEEKRQWHASHEFEFRSESGQLYILRQGEYFRNPDGEEWALDVDDECEFVASVELPEVLRWIAENKPEVFVQAGLSVAVEPRETRD